MHASLLLYVCFVNKHGIGDDCRKLRVIKEYQKITSTESDRATNSVQTIVIFCTISTYTMQRFWVISKSHIKYLLINSITLQDMKVLPQDSVVGRHQCVRNLRNWSYIFETTPYLSLAHWCHYTLRCSVVLVPVHCRVSFNSSNSGVVRSPR